MSYDAPGHVTTLWKCAPSICGGSNQSSRPAIQTQYDLAGFLTYESDAASGGIRYGRSPAGEITSMTNETYNDQINPGTLVSNVVNSPFGPLTYQLGNGLSSNQTYDSMGRLDGTWVCQGTTSPFCNGGGGLYGNLDTIHGTRVTSICDTVLNQCQNNGYDEFNRLASVTANPYNQGSPGSFTYTYDRYGNRLSQSSINGGPSPSYTVDPATNHLGGISYDAAGNAMNDGLAHSYTYDAEGNVLAVDGGQTASYVFDAQNRRVRVQNSSGTLEFLSDAMGRRTSTWNAANNFGIEGRIYMDGRQLAFRGGNGGETIFDGKDVLGTERLRTNYAGQMVTYGRSLAFGDGFDQSVYTPNADQDNSQFAGLDLDGETGTSHATFRQLSTNPGPVDESRPVRRQLRPCRSAEPEPVRVCAKQSAQQRRPVWTEKGVDMRRVRNLRRRWGWARSGKHSREWRKQHLLRGRMGRVPVPHHRFKCRRGWPSLLL